MNELTDPEREAVAVAREKIGTGGYALFNRLYLEFGGYRAEMHFAHGYLVALTQLDALRAELLAANEQITQLRAVLADAQHVFLAISEAGRRAENGRLQKVLDSIAQVYRAHNDFAAKHDVRAILDRGPTGGAKCLRIRKDVLE